MGPKKAAAPGAGQMSMTSFFMKKPAVQTPAVKEPATQSGSSSAQDQATPFVQDASAITSKSPPLGSGPALSDTASKKPESESKPVKRRLEEFASDEASDNDNAAVSSSAKKNKPAAAVEKVEKREKKEVGSPKKKAKTVAGAKSTSSGNERKARTAKAKANKKKMVIESDDEEKEWNEDDDDAASASAASEEGDSASAFSEDESLEDSEDESLVDSDSDGDSESEEEEERVVTKRKPAARKTTNNSSAPSAPPAAKKASSPLSSFDASNSAAANTGCSSNPSSASKAAPLYLKEGVFNDGKHQHDTWDWLHANLKDKAGKRPTDQDYNPRTLSVPAQFLKEQTPAMAQWWQFKQENLDTVLFFKVGKFYELFHMDADVGMRELDLIYMKGEKAHSGFPEISYGKFANALVAKGYRVARVEQTETPDMLAARNKRTGGVKAKVVAREMCSVMSKGTRTYCHLDDCATTLLESSSSVLMCVKEGLVADGTDGRAPEYGVCCVDTVLGTVTLAQFSDNSQRTRLRTMVSQFSPNEVLLEYAQHTDETRGVIRLLCPAAKTEELRAGEMPSASGAIDMLAKGGYFAAPGSSSSVGDLNNWPVVLQAVAQGLEGGSALAAMALGGATWLLKRSQIDYEVLSMGRVFGYVPPDDADNAVSDLVTSHASSASVTAGQVRDLSSAGETTAAMEQGNADADAKAANSASSLLMGGTAGSDERTSMTMDAVTLYVFCYTSVLPSCFFFIVRSLSLSLDLLLLACIL
jgi:DNA mismatch repair protein MSH6